MIGVLGAGAFGTALAVSLARDGQPVTLWARNADQVADMATRRENAARLPGVSLPDPVQPTADIADLSGAGTILLATPAQSLCRVLTGFADALVGKHLVACCKGIDLDTGDGPSAIIARAVPGARPALLSGPSFAVDIAAGQPTALTLAAPDDASAEALQHQLSTGNLRLYRSTDMTGVEIGGAMKNVVAIACGIAIGAGLGESARAALMTRGYAEMLRFALARNARGETLAGLSGLGDMALTATCEKSRNYAFGLRLGAKGQGDPTATTEGIATARAVARIAAREGLEMPVTAAMAAVLEGAVTVGEAVEMLMTRPLRPE
ncbi:MAG: NAD(P)-dependent glycerol-3-phosphate dehydrogenase [Rhodobacteraceae bacterium]|nr:NAD(P)-dependent glycerol-3-phosphate dehydrogenase [Paracoccaceae bacterium]